MYVGAPWIDVEALPDTERESGNSIQGSLTALSHTVEDLETALALFDRCQGERIAPNTPGTTLAMRRDHNMLRGRWEMMSARIGAIAIFEHRKALQAIGELLADCPKLSSLIDRQPLRAASDAFKASFPDYGGLRHFAAHGSEMTSRPSDANKHTAPGPLTVAGLTFESSPLAVGTLMNRTYVCTFKGRPIHYELTQGTAAALGSVRDLTFAAFPTR